MHKLNCVLRRAGPIEPGTLNVPPRSSKRALLQKEHDTRGQLVTLGDTLHSWSEEIARMGRFTRSNGITESFHNKMETISRQAFSATLTSVNECRCCGLNWSCWDRDLFFPSSQLFQFYIVALRSDPVSL